MGYDGGKGKGKGWGKWDMMSMMMSMMGGGKGKGKGKEYGSFKIDESGGVLGEFTGTIKSFSFRSGYGFIESADVQAMGHQDVWMHADMKGSLEVGAAVKFTAFQNA